MIVEFVFPLSCFLLQPVNYIHYILCQKTQKIKNLLLRTLSTAKILKRKERVLRVKNLMRTNSETKICDIVNF